MKTRIGVMLGLIAAVAATAFAADAIKLDGVKCVVAASKPAKEANSVDYKGGKVFFCCQNCPKAFSKDTAKYAARANAQLVATGQAKQTACPLSGQPVDEATAVKVDGVSVAFCCEKCQGKVEAASDKASLVFNDKAFDKAFKVSK